MGVGVNPGALVDGLEQTLRCVERVGEQLSAVELRSAPDGGGWSANEILWHIRATADVYGEQIARILEEDEPRWRHVSPRARMKKARYDQLEFAESAKAFAVQREQLIARLRGLAPEAWGRFAVVRVAHRESEFAVDAGGTGFGDGGSRGGSLPGDGGDGWSWRRGMTGGAVRDGAGVETIRPYDRD